jgi:hypothetical protein
MKNRGAYFLDLKKIEKELVDVNLLPHFPFRGRGWQADLFESALHFVESDFEVLINAIKDIAGDERMFVVNFEMHGKLLPPDMPVEWEIGLSWSEFDDKVQSSPLGNLGLYLWGPSRKWAVICSYGEYLVYGGEPAFIREIEAHYGGREEIRARFFAYVEEGGPNISKDFALQMIRAIYPESIESS